MWAFDTATDLIITSDEGLQQTGTQMHQIPTYVTSVPNGTEKVFSHFSLA